MAEELLPVQEVFCSVEIFLHLFNQHYKNYSSTNYRLLIRNARIKVLRIQYSTHRLPLRFVCISEQATISPCSIKRLIFTTEMNCVCCAVRAESLNKAQENLLHLDSFFSQ